MPIDDFLNSTPPPSLAPDALGLPAMPQAPQVPQAPQPKTGLMHTLMQAVPGILGGAMGPGAGTGLLQGAVMGQQRNEQQARLDHQEAMQGYYHQQQAYSQQAQQYEMAERQRQQVLQQTLTSLRTQTKDAPDKAAYDAYVEAYGQGLQSMGYRLDANWLRKAVPYVAPKADKLAWETLEKWQKLPNNKQLLEKHPEQAASAMIPFDRDGDGEPELISLQDLSVLAGAPMAMTEDGKVFSNPGTTQEVKANADGILQQLIAKAKAEKKLITPALLVTLQQQAIRMAEEAKPDTRGGAVGGGADPLVQAVIANPELWDQLTPSARTRISPALAAQGFEGFGKPLNESAITKLADGRAAMESLRDLRDILKANEQYIGPIAGLQALNPYSEARRAQADIDRVRQRVGKALEGGVLRKEDEEKYKKILATLRDEPATAIYKVDQLIQSIEKDIKAFEDEQRRAGRRVTSPTPEAAGPPQPNTSAGGGPKVGERRKFGDQLGEWDGRGWKAVP